MLNKLIHLDKYEIVQAVYPYEGLDEQELTFPEDAFIKLLRKNTKKKRIDGEEWWEGKCFIIYYFDNFNF